MDALMILFAKYLYLIVILLVVVYTALSPRDKQKRILLLAAICLPLIYIVAKIAGHYYYDPRPFVSLHIKPLIPHAPDNGFPSDHTLISAAFAAVLSVFNKKWGIAAFALTVLVGISRIYVHVHSPIDVIGSIAISIIVVTLVVISLRKFFRLGI